MTTTPATQPTTSPAPGRPLHNAGEQPNPMYDRLIHGKTPADWAIRIVLVAVMTAALAVGTWSIYTLLTTVFGVPQFVAILGCGMFDGAALFFALLSQRYATTTDSGFAPRLAMLAMVSISSWVNWQHAQLEKWGTVGGVILAAAPGIAELAFLMFHKFAHRETLRNLGRVPQALPTLGKWAWLAHPARSRKTVDAHIKAALTEHEAVAQRREDLAADRAKTIITIPVSVETQTRETVETTRVPVSAPTQSRLAIETTVSAQKVSTETGETKVSRSTETSETAPVETAETETETRETETRSPASPASKSRRETETTTVRAIGDRETETNKLLDLMRSRGNQMAVSLNDAIEETGRPKATAAKRLKTARDLYLAETG